MIFNKKLIVNKNTNIIIKNTMLAFFVKGMALVVSLLSTPAYVEYFDDNIVLGVWYTMLSILMWFLNFDLGIGNGIRNKLVKDLTNNDRIEAKKTISSGFFANFVTTIVLGIVGYVLLTQVNLEKIFNLEGQYISNEALICSTFFVFVAVLLRFFLTTVSSILYALQKSAVNDFILLCVNVLQLVFVTLASFETKEQKLIGLSMAYMILSNAPIIVVAIIIFFTTLKDCKPHIKCITKANCISILNVGTIFFACQVLYMLIINSNEFLITLIYGPQDTTEYTFYYKVTSLVSTAAILALTPVWSIVTKAMTEKNYTWLNKLYIMLKRMGVVAIIVQILLVPFYQYIMNFWLQENTINVEIGKSVALAVFGGVLVYSSVHSTFACGMAKMKVQAVCYTIGVALKILVIFSPLNQMYSWELVIWCNIFILLLYSFVQQLYHNHFFKKYSL